VFRGDVEPQGQPFPQSDLKKKKKKKLPSWACDKCFSIMKQEKEREKGREGEWEGDRESQRPRKVNSQVLRCY
jgi:hypothetical protein